MEWYWVVGAVVGGWVVGSIGMGLALRKLFGAIKAIKAEMVRMEVDRKAAPPRDTPLRVPYEERLKKEYEKRGLTYDLPVKKADG
jgi:hypothetical protein